MPKIANLKEFVDTFFRDHITFPDIPGLAEGFAALPKAVLTALEQVPEETPEMGLKGQPLFLLPGIKLADFACVFDRQVNSRDFERTSNNFLCLAAYYLKASDITNFFRDPTPNQIGNTLIDRRVPQTYSELRDALGRHIAQFAALAGNFDTLKLLLDHPFRTTITIADQDAIMACAVASGSEKCMGYITGTFGISPKYKNADESLPLLKLRRDEIYQNFKTMNDEDLYRFIKQYSSCKITKDSKPYGLLANYMLLGGDLRECQELFLKLQNLENSSIMLNENYDITLVISLQEEGREFGMYMVLGFADLYYLDWVRTNNYQKLVSHGLRAIHPTLTRNHEWARDNIKHLIDEALKQDRPDILKYFVTKKWTDISLLKNKYLLSACCEKKLGIVKYIIEECGINDIDEQLCLNLALKTEDNPVVAYLLNRVKFWYASMNSVTERLQQFEFSEAGVNLLFDKTSYEVCRYLHFMLLLIKNPVPKAGVNFSKLSVDTRIKAFKSLQSAEQVADQPREVRVAIIEMQADVLASLERDQATHSDEQTKQFLAFKQQALEVYAKQLAMVVDPFLKPSLKFTAYQNLKAAAEMKRFGAENYFIEAQKFEANRLIQLVVNNQGDLFRHIDELEVLAKNNIPAAKDFVMKRNDRLAVEIRNDALNKNEKRFEDELREFAKGHPYARLQLAVLLIERYRKSNFKFLNKEIAAEALEILNDKQIADFPETMYYKGVCYWEGMSTQLNFKQTGLQFYFRAAQQGCALASETLTSLHKTKGDTVFRELSYRASVYSAILAFNPTAHGSNLDNLAEKNNSLFVKCMLDILHFVRGPAIELWQMTLTHVKTSVEREAFEKNFSQYLLKFDLTQSKEFAAMISKLTPELCAKYALRFIHDISINSDLRRAWIVAAEMKWVNSFGNEVCAELTQLQQILKNETTEKVQSVRQLFQAEVSSVVCPATNPTNVMITPAPKVMSLQDRLHLVGPNIEVPHRLRDPMHLEIMNNPGLSDDNRFYDECSFKLLKGTKSPIKEVILQNFIPSDELRTEAIEFVEEAERDKKRKEAASTSSTSSTSIAASVQTGLTFYAKPSAPPLDFPDVAKGDVVDLAVMSAVDDDLVPKQSTVAVASAQTS